MIQLLTQKFSAVTEANKRRIVETQDPDKLDQARGLILKSESIEENLRSSTSEIQEYSQQFIQSLK